MKQQPHEHVTVEFIDQTMCKKAVIKKKANDLFCFTIEYSSRGSAFVIELTGLSMFFGYMLHVERYMGVSVRKGFQEKTEHVTDVIDHKTYEVIEMDPWSEEVKYPPWVADWAYGSVKSKKKEIFDMMAVDATVFGALVKDALRGVADLLLDVVDDASKEIVLKISGYRDIFCMSLECRSKINGISTEFTLSVLDHRLRNSVVRLDIDDDDCDEGGRIRVHIVPIEPYERATSIDRRLDEIVGRRLGTLTYGRRADRFIIDMVKDALAYACTARELFVSVADEPGMRNICDSVRWRTGTCNACRRALTPGVRVSPCPICMCHYQVCDECGRHVIIAHACSCKGAYETCWVVSSS